ncbi:MAG: HAMP domain-containing histidine kinase [Deltaproteobacteria bacterium]|nr:HAMP domain-containing histidine kinase [Deltaproteobacteria bacterium]
MRTVFAAILTAAALVALLVGWFGAGWSGVRAEDRALHGRAQAEAVQAARVLADDLAAHLEELRRSESQRPYYHYGNLFHDPRSASEGWSVTPSPLASGPTDPLVLGHFQIDSAGKVTVPTINDNNPELSDPNRLAADRVLRTEVAAIERQLIVPADASATGGGPLVASIAGEPSAAQLQAPVASTATKPSKSYDDQGFAKKSRKTRIDKPLPEKQVLQVSSDVYMQNAIPEQIYDQVKQAPRNGRASTNAPDDTIQARGQQPQQSSPPPLQEIQQQVQLDEPAPRVRRAPVQQQAPRAAPTPAPVTVTIAPFEWRSVALAGPPALVAVRRVDTPDGGMTQGFVVDRAAIEDWLADRAQRDVRLVEGEPADPALATAPIGVGAWRVAFDAGAAVSATDDDARALYRDFLRRFIPIAVLALACGALVVLLVARAERMARERARFAAAAAHELRTPLAGLQLYGDMLADGLGDPSKARDYAKRMAEEASRLGRVVSNVLGFSQLERGNLAVHPAPGDLAPAIADTCERARPALERAGVALEVRCPDDLRARFDSDALARVLGNLLDNAEKYGRGADAPRAIVVDARATAAGAEIAVVDRGPGVTARAQARLFRPFARGDDGDGPARLGLGLALSRSLATAMGGDLAYRPTDGGGATFVIQLAAA